MNGYPEIRHPRLVTWQQLMEWGVPCDRLPGDLSEAHSEETSFVYGATEDWLRQELGMDNWTVDSLGPAGMVIRAGPGHRFGEGLTIIPDQGEPAEENGDSHSQGQPPPAAGG